MARDYMVTPQWLETKSVFRESYLNEEGDLYDSYSRMGCDTVNVTDIGVKGDYNLMVMADLHNLRNNAFGRYPLYRLDENGKRVKAGTTHRPIYGWVWGMKDMQHYHALWLRSCVKDDYVYMNDMIEYCIVTVNGNDTTYHTHWRPYLYDEQVANTSYYNIWIEYSNNTAWIGGGYNLDIPWAIVRNIESFGTLTGVYLGEGAELWVKNATIIVEDKETMPLTGYNRAKLDYYFSHSNIQYIEGFWDVTLDNRDNDKLKMGGDYSLGIVAHDNQYLIIYLSGGTVYPGKWNEGAVKGLLTPTEAGFYEAIWYDAEGVKMDNILAFQRGDELVLDFVDEDSRLILTRTKEFITDEPQGPKRTSGSGFAIDSDGYIVTNYHVIENMNNIAVFNEHLAQGYNVVVVATDTVNDLAILRIEDEEFTSLGTIPYEISNREPRKGEAISCLGYPNPSILTYEMKSTQGSVMALNGYVPSVYMISIDIDHGSSGGPIFDENGDILGIVVSGYFNGLNLTSNFAIKTSYLYDLIEQVDDIEPLPGNTIKELSFPDKVERIAPYVFVILCME